MTKHPRLAALVALLALLAMPVRAKKNDPQIRLTWSPQQRVAAVDADVSAEMLRLPVALEVTDRRGLEDAAILGTRTDDDDRQWTLVSTEGVAEWVERSASVALGDWGIELRDGSERTLRLGLLRVRVVESNQAVGATYEASVRFEASLLSSDDGPLWSGEAAGDATRYGKKFSEANVSEVLSDALLEALGVLSSDRGLHRAWAGERVAAGGGAPAPAIAPEDLLADVRRLAAESVPPAQLVRFVTGRTLTRVLDADDLLAWRDAGLPEGVIDAVLDLPVR